MNLLERQWAAFEQTYVHAAGLPEALPALKYCYYAGMLAMFVLWTDVPELKAQIDRELDEFNPQKEWQPEPGTLAHVFWKEHP